MRTFYLDDRKKKKVEYSFRATKKGEEQVFLLFLYLFIYCNMLKAGNQGSAQLLAYTLELMNTMWAKKSN